MEQLKKGYKKTEVGLIPEDWDLKTIDEIFKFYSTSNYSKAEMFFEGEVGCIHYGLIHAIQNTIYSLENGIKYYITSEQAKYEFVKDGDVVMVDASEDLVGINKSVELKDVNGKKYISGLHTYLLRDINSILADNFRGQILNSELIKTQLLRFAVGMKVFGVSKPQLKQILLPIPTLIEQKAIADALTDVDELITNLEKLIAKKKAIKQGAMQQLLTPKEHWKSKPIRELATYRRGSFPQPYGLSKWYDDISGTPFVQVVDVDNNKRLKKETKARISKEGQKYSVFVPKSSIILTIQGSIGRICITDYDAYVDRTLLIFESLIEDFNKYFFMMSIFLKFEIEKEKAPGGIIKTITKEALSSFMISFPEIEEQNYISEILKNMDNEIELLEKKLEKKRIIKQGMMQELLTGKTRLI
jgi:type I restriction enzyme S subunit